jgi:hypothetical protein
MGNFFSSCKNSGEKKNLGKSDSYPPIATVISDETIEENKSGGVNFDVEFTPKKKKEAQRRGIYLSRIQYHITNRFKKSIHDQLIKISFKQLEQADFSEKLL